MGLTVRRGTHADKISLYRLLGIKILKRNVGNVGLVLFVRRGVHTDSKKKREPLSSLCFSNCFFILLLTLVNDSQVRKVSFKDTENGYFDKMQLYLATTN